MTVLDPARTPTRPLTPDPAIWDAPSPVCGCTVQWRQQYAGEPVPGVCGCDKETTP